MYCMNNIKKVIADVEQKIIRQDISYKEIIDLAESAGSFISGSGMNVDIKDATEFNHILADMVNCLETGDLVYLYDIVVYILPAFLTAVSEKYGIEG